MIWFQVSVTTTLEKYLVHRRLNDFHHAVMARVQIVLRRTIALCLCFIKFLTKANLFVIRVTLQRILRVQMIWIQMKLLKKFNCEGLQPMLIGTTNPNISKFILCHFNQKESSRKGPDYLVYVA